MKNKKKKKQFIEPEKFENFQCTIKKNKKKLNK